MQLTTGRCVHLLQAFPVTLMFLTLRHWPEVSGLTNFSLSRQAVTQQESMSLPERIDLILTTVLGVSCEFNSLRHPAPNLPGACRPQTRSSRIAKARRRRRRLKQCTDNGKLLRNFGNARSPCNCGSWCFCRRSTSSGTLPFPQPGPGPSRFSKQDPSAIPASCLPLQLAACEQPRLHGVS